MVPTNGFQRFLKDTLFYEHNQFYKEVFVHIRKKGAKCWKKIKEEMKADLVFYQVANFRKVLGKVDFLSWIIDT